MHEAISKMLAKYECRGLNDAVNALREIVQEVALLGLWRGKFFEKAAFYGGTALRVLYGLDRFSEDMDFSLLSPSRSFDIGRYAVFLEKEAKGFGLDVRFEKIDKAVQTPIQSAFLKTNTRSQLLVIETGEEMAQTIPKGRILKVKIEVDTDPPLGFETQTRYLLQPIPFAVRVYSLPDLFAGKIHAILYRRWKGRVKGRDWYDLVWYAANYPDLNLHHLEQRMRQTGDWQENRSVQWEDLKAFLNRSITELNVEQARKEVEPFVRSSENLAIWSPEFFRDVISRIRPVHRIEQTDIG
ncbi:conserved hypothetical protein [delta proteobacterium NaphS2]|nr:conserved hypothetical protein [delta proteobacterium NaphS2]